MVLRLRSRSERGCFEKKMLLLWVLRICYSVCGETGKNQKRNYESVKLHKTFRAIFAHYISHLCVPNVFFGIWVQVIKNPGS